MKYHPNLSIGTLLLRPKFFGIVQHEGVVVGYNAVLHNTPDKGEHVSTLNEFAAGAPVEAQITEADPVQLVTRVQQLLSKPQDYDLLRRNCQHTASQLIRGAAKSPWVIGVAVVLVVIAGIWALSVLLRRS
jgi:hypothetical protein